jgi:hypothetical protein
MASFFNYSGLSGKLQSPEPFVDVKQEKRHDQKSEENHVNARLKRLPKARQRFLKPL